jgi:hypothetical protein
MSDDKYAVTMTSIERDYVQMLKSNGKWINKNDSKI